MKKILSLFNILVNFLIVEVKNTLFLPFGISNPLISISFNALRIISDDSTSTLAIIGRIFSSYFIKFA